MQGAQNLRREAYSQVRRNDEGEVQRSRWTFCETIKIIDIKVVYSKNASNLVSCVMGKSFRIVLWIGDLD
jgi:hypothetical protein